MSKKPRRTFYIPVTVGDIVEVRDPIYERKIKAVGPVIKVERRYGLHNQGSRILAPLIAIRNSETGKEEFFCNSLVSRVLQHYSGPIRQPYNYFREERSFRKDDFWAVRTKKTGIICGPLVILAESLLANFSLHLPHPIDPVKLEALFRKNGLGLVRRDGSFIHVRRKYFEKWLRKNACRVCKTTSQLTAEGTLAAQMDEENYRMWVESDAEEDDRQKQEEEFGETPYDDP